MAPVRKPCARAVKAHYPVPLRSSLSQYIPRAATSLHTPASLSAASENFSVSVHGLPLRCHTLLRNGYQHGRRHLIDLREIPFI